MCELDWIFIALGVVITAFYAVTKTKLNKEYKELTGSTGEEV